MDARRKRREASGATTTATTTASVRGNTGTCLNKLLCSSKQQDGSGTTVTISKTRPYRYIVPEKNVVDEQGYTTGGGCVNHYARPQSRRLRIFHLYSAPVLGSHCWE